MFWQKNWFTIALLVTPFLAWLWPELGADQGILQGGIVNKVGIAAIFFVSGLLIRTQLLIRTTWKIKLHLFIQFFCFVVFPTLVYCIHRWLLDYIDIDQTFKTGILILGCLPTTITSCVVMTRMAHGDEAVSLFNGVLSNMVGVFVSPLILQALLGFGGGGQLDINLSPMITTLAVMVLLPISTGHLLRNLFQEWIDNNARGLRRVSSSCMLFIMYSVFCDTVLTGREMDSPLAQIATLVLVISGMHLLFLGLAHIGCRLFDFSVRERRSIVLTAPQKTLAMGMPLVAFIVGTPVFASTSTSIALYALPLLVYHHVQLLIAALILPFYKKHPAVVTQ